MKWISVKDQMPTVNQEIRILLLLKVGGVYLGSFYFDSYKGENIFRIPEIYEWYFEDTDEITHWMPLPEKPE